MPQVTMPDGSVVEMPENLTPEQGMRLRAYIAAQHAPKQEPKPEETKPVEFTTGNLNKGLAGALGAPVDIAQDVLNLGKAGVGTAAIAAGHPELAPEVRTDAIGGSQWFESLMRQHKMITDAATPTSTGGKIAAAGLQMAGNLGGGVVVPAGAARAASKIENIIKRPPAEGIIQGEEQSAKTYRDLRKEGYKFPPAQVKPGLVNNKLEGAAGKAQTEHALDIENSQVTSKLAKKAIGVSQNTPLNEETIQLVKDEAGATYDKVRAFDKTVTATPKYLKDISSLNGEFSTLEKKFPKLTKDEEVDELKKILTNPTFLKEGMTSSEAIDLTRLLRNKATQNFKAANSALGGNPEKLAIAQAQRDAAQHVEDLLSQTLKKEGKEALYREWVDARKSFAIAHDVESAMNETTGTVSPQILAALDRKGRPLSGELATIVKFAKAAPKVSRVPEKVGGVPDQVVDLMLATMGGGVGAHLGGTTGAMAGAAAGGAARSGVRNFILSDLYQNRLVK